MADNIQAVGLELDATQYERAIARLERRTNDLEDRFDDVTRAGKRQGQALDGLGKKVVALVAAYGGFRAAERSLGFIFRTNVEFEKLEATLKTVTGSVDQAEDSFNLITEFARTTPFEVQNLTQSFVQLRAFGFNQTEEDMRGLGNVSAAFTEDITRLSDAVISAANGMARPLRAFGINAVREGDKVTLTYQDVTETVDATAEAIGRFVAQIGNTQFADAMTERMKTLDGSISNLQDSASLLAKAIGEAELNGEIQNLVQTLDVAIAENERFAEVIGESLAAGVRVSTDALELFIQHTDLVVVGLQALTSATIVFGVARLATNIGRAKDAMLAFNAAMARNPATVILTLAAAIGGPLLVNLLTAKDEAEKLADEIERLGDRDLSGLTGEQLQGFKRDLEAQNEEINAALRSGGVKGGGAADRLARNQALIDLVNAEQLRRQTVPGVEVNVGDPSSDAEAVEKFIQSLEEERLRLEEGERAALAYRLQKQGIVGDAQAEVLALFDSVEGLKREQDAREDAEKAQERQSKAIENTLEQLRSQNIELEQGEEAFLRHSLAAQGATKEQIELAVKLFRTNEQITRQTEQLEKQEKERLAELEAELNQVKNAADRMAEGVSDSFVDVITGTEDVVDAFGRMVDGIIRELLRLTLRKTITDPLSSAISGALSGAIGGAAEGDLVDLDGPIGSDPITGFQPRQQSQVSPVVLNQTVNLSVNAIDSRDASRFIRERRGEIAQATAEAAQESFALQAALRGG